jgi:hypothetical protein
MGAGTYYTHPCNGERAAWVNIGQGEDDDVFIDEHEFVLQDITNILADAGYGNMRNGLAMVDLVSTYDGDGLIIQISPRVEEYESSYNLFTANFDRMQQKIWRSLQKAGYSLRIATSGYTSQILEKI